MVEESKRSSRANRYRTTQTNLSFDREKILSVLKYPMMSKIGIDLFFFVNVVLINCEDTRNVKLVILLSSCQDFCKKIAEIVCKVKSKTYLKTCTKIRVSFILTKNKIKYLFIPVYLFLVY